jgi:hypothetical protein
MHVNRLLLGSVKQKQELQWLRGNVNLLLLDGSVKQKQRELEVFRGNAKTRIEWPLPGNIPTSILDTLDKFNEGTIGGL